jgi:two-component system sensor histidine kinase/response regulator
VSQRPPPRAAVLLVDNDPERLAQLRAAIDGVPDDLVAVGSAAEAIRELLARSFVLIIARAGMVRCEVVRPTPVIWFAAVEADLERAYAAGAADVLVGKPTPAVLRAKARRCIDAARHGLALQADNDALRAALVRRETLAAYMVHDLRGALLAMGSNAEVLVRSAGTDEPSRGLASSVLDAARELTAMTADLLAIYRHDDGMMEPDVGPVDLGGLLGEVRTAAAGRLGQRDLRLEVHVLQDVPPIAGDARLLRRLAENLLDNCLKYVAVGGSVTIELDAAADGRVELRFRDDGPGIPPEMRDAVFERFVRVDGEAPSREAGWGLGLAFCRMAAEAHGGQIWVDANEPHGSVFHVVLPAVARAEPKLVG